MKTFMQLECEVSSKPSLSISPNDIITCDFSIKDRKGVERRVSTVESNAIFAFTYFKKGTVITMDALNVFNLLSHEKDSKIVASTMEVVSNPKNKLEHILKEVELKFKFFTHHLFSRQEKEDKRLI